MNRKKRIVKFAPIVIVSVLVMIGVVWNMVYHKKPVSKIEWIHELASSFNQDELSELPENYFSDLPDNSQYYEDAVWAVQKGLLDIEEGGELNPKENVTREFAAHSLNSCMGIILEDDDPYTYLDVDNADYPEDNQVAINQGWMELENGFFDAEGKVFAKEVNRMMDNVESILSLSDIQDEYESVYEYSEDVIEVPKNTDIMFDENDDVIKISGGTDDIEAGDHFVVYQSDLPIAYKD